MTRTGASAVIAAAVGGAGEALRSSAAGSEPEQLGLLAPPTRFDGARAQEITAKLERYHAGRGGGRPKGSQNKATAQFRKWLLAQGEDPLESMYRWSQHSPETLAMEIGCTTAEAYDRLMSLKAQLAAYLHPRLAPVNDDGQAVPMFNMTILAGAGATVSGLPPWLADPEVRKTLEAAVAQHEQDQGLSGDATGRPAETRSTEEGQDADNVDENSG